MKKLVTGTLFASAFVIGMAFTTSCTVHTTARVPARSAVIVQPRPVVVAKPRRARQSRRNNVVVVRRR